MQEEKYIHKPYPEYIYLCILTNKHTNEIKNNTLDIKVMRHMINALHTSTILDILGPFIELESSSNSIQSLSTLMNNKLPANLIQPKHIEKMLDHIANELAHNYSTYSILRISLNRSFS